jgi:mannose-6-phosphate isomerase-like protein (cupin superfamily)
MKLRFILSLALATTLSALAQPAPVVHFSTELAQREAKLLAAAKASPSGNAFDTFDDIGSYKTLLVVRVHTGDAELHEQWADQMVITKGTLTLVTGGTMQEGHITASGETRGPGIQGGKEVILRPGDIVRIPAHVPHWVKLTPGTTTSYLVFKEK